MSLGKKKKNNILNINWAKVLGKKKTLHTNPNWTPFYSWAEFGCAFHFLRDLRIESRKQLYIYMYKQFIYKNCSTCGQILPSSLHYSQGKIAQMTQLPLSAVTWTFCVLRLRSFKSVLLSFFHCLQVSECMYNFLQQQKAEKLEDLVTVQFMLSTLEKYLLECL